MLSFFLAHGTAFCYNSHEVKQMIAPDIRENLEEAMLEQAVQDALQGGMDIEHCHFYGEEMPDGSGRMLEFSGCVFEKCTLGEMDIQRLVFVDCRFIKCDLSRCNFRKATLQRVQFQECRLTGAAFDGSSLMSVHFSDCQMDFCNFSNAKAQQLHMQHCAMKENAFIGFKWKSWLLDDCDMQGCEFAETSLKGMDVSNCEIGHWLVDAKALNGLKVTQAQALGFAALLGLQLTDP